MEQTDGQQLRLMPHWWHRGHKNRSDRAGWETTTGGTGAQCYYSCLQPTRSERETQDPSHAESFPFFINHHQ